MVYANFLVIACVSKYLEEKLGLRNGYQKRKWVLKTVTQPYNIEMLPNKKNSNLSLSDNLLG
jgi:hypothetical protein